MTQITIGVDVSKDTLDLHLHPDGLHRQFINDAAGFRLILDGIGSRPVARLVFEATGANHHAFERARPARMRAEPTSHGLGSTNMPGRSCSALKAKALSFCGVMGVPPFANHFVHTDASAQAA